MNDETESSGLRTRRTEIWGNNHAATTGICLFLLYFSFLVEIEQKIGWFDAPLARNSQFWELSLLPAEFYFFHHAISNFLTPVCFVL